MVSFVISIVLAAFFTLTGCSVINAFASPSKGWRKRPSFPELAKSNKVSGKSRTKKESWDALRFFQQSSKFISMPSFGKSESIVVRPGDIIWKPGVQSSSNNNFGWAPLDDVVMGGVSSSSIDNETGIWKGTVSDTNNGGFVGVRTTPFSKVLNMENCSGVTFQLKGGDGNRFKAVIRDSTDFNGVCWTTSFGTPKGFFEQNKMATVKVSFNDQTPTIFAKTVPGEIFNAENTVGLQLAYSKFEYDGDINPKFSLGEFSLQIVEVRAY